MTGPHPTLRHRQLAKRLRELRLSSGLTIDEVAQEMGCSASRISRLETAQRGILPSDVRKLCKIYRMANEEQLEYLLALVRDVKQHGWWHDFEDLDLNPYIELEAAASTIINYETSIVPALVQTEEYAGAIIRGSLPRIREATLAGRVKARLKRQQLLAQENPPYYWMLLDESVLHRHIGGAGVMYRQLEKLIEYADHPHVMLQVIPYTEGAHMGMNAGFVLLETQEPGIPDTVYIESILGGTYYEKPTEVAKFREALEHLRAIALNPQRSISLMTEIAATLKSSPVGHWQKPLDQE